MAAGSRLANTAPAVRDIRTPSGPIVGPIGMTPLGPDPTTPAAAPFGRSALKSASRGLRTTQENIAPATTVLARNTAVPRRADDRPAGTVVDSTIEGLEALASVLDLDSTDTATPRSGPRRRLT
jgi:hypothetical protein